MRRLGLLLWLMCCGLPAWGAKPVVGTLADPGEPGCYLYRRQHSMTNAKPIFYSIVSEETGESVTHMKIDGQIKTLQDVPKQRQDDAYAEYTTGSYRVFVKFGSFTEAENSEGVYKHALLKVQRGNEITVIKAIGYCGC